jgi:hypothetical protein
MSQKSGPVKEALLAAQVLQARCGYFLRPRGAPAWLSIAGSSDCWLFGSLWSTLDATQK